MRRLVVLVTLVSVSMLFVNGCDPPASSYGEQLCNAMTDCMDMSMKECLTFYGSLILSLPCFDAMLAASCEDHNSDTPSYMDVCFDPCEVEGQECIGLFLYYCIDGRDYMLDCWNFCEYNGNKSFAEVCDEIGPNGQVSEDGEICWCE